MIAVYNLLDTVVSLYIWVLLASVILSWLVSFEIVNPRQPVVRTVGEFLWRVTEPALRPIRRVLPDLGGFDLSPVVLILALYFVRDLVKEMLF